MKGHDITLCLTIGRRPELLRQTLTSIFDRMECDHIIAINDFRDEETNQVFRELCPHGKLINLDKQLGHHLAVDTMYAQVETSYIFHCEDDWLFDQPIEIEKYLQLLQNNKKATAICLRKLSDFPFSDEEKSKIQYLNTQPLDTACLIQVHEQWYGYTFNPHIVPLQLWKDIGGFAQFKKERHVSRYLRKKAMYNLFLKENICHHIGWEDSLANPPKTTFWSKAKGNFLG